MGTECWEWSDCSPRQAAAKIVPATPATAVTIITRKRALALLADLTGAHPDQALQMLDYKRITHYPCKTEITFYFANHD
jgi:hypothetical protein